ncbi:MAG: hypothetical protein C4586_09690 [Anaerolineaceae bacterium]|nr:MAG: hypothetical protein C4586_09690 [Anaerolineaceae bacterium]
MPTIFEPGDLPVTEKNGVNIATLANHAMLGTDALQVERIILEARTKSSSFESFEPERFIYVIRGKGQAQVGEQTFPLDAESMLWLEKDDTFYLEADMDGLEVLLCHAPGNE